MRILEPDATLRAQSHHRRHLQLRPLLPQPHDEAAAVAVGYPAFKGWYRITADRCDHTQHRLTLTVRRL